ncbi:MAG: flagellar hook-basal body complex protein, partial [Thermodesulfobacteriota bacterium]
MLTQGQEPKEAKPVYVGYFYAVRGAMGQEQRLDALAANLANANTPGFKQGKIAFEDYLILTQRNDYSQGAVRQTERDLDLAIQGPGFFKVLTPRGEAYTRNGTFRTDREGNLLTGEGHRVLGLKGPINVGTGKEPVLVDNQGTVFKGQVEIDRLRVVDLPDKTNLQHQGGSLLVW